MKFSSKFFGGKLGSISLSEDTFVHFTRCDHELKDIALIQPDFISGCDFIVVKYKDRYSGVDMYLCAHMSGRYDELFEELDLITSLARPESIRIEVAHSKQANESRLHLIQQRLGISTQQCTEYSLLPTEAHFDLPTFTIKV